MIHSTSQHIEKHRSIHLAVHLEMQQQATELELYGVSKKIQTKVKLRRPSSKQYSIDRSLEQTCRHFKNIMLQRKNCNNLVTITRLSVLKSFIRKAGLK